MAASVAFLAMHATRLHFEGEEPEVARQLLGDAAFDGLVYDAKLQDAYRFEQALRTMGANPQARDFPKIGNTLIHLIARYGERPGVSELWISDRIKTLRKRGCDNRCAVDFHGSAPLLAGLETHSVVFAKSILRAELGEAWCRHHLLALPLWNVDSRRHKLFQAGCGKALSEQIRLGLANPIQRLSGDAQCYLYTPMHRAALKGAHKAIPLLWLLGLDGSCQVKPTFSKKIRLMRVSRRKSGRGQEDSMRSASLVSSDHGSDEEKTTDFEDLFRNELGGTGLQVEDGDARPAHQQEFGEQERDPSAPDAEQTNKFHRDAAGAGRASRAPGRNSFHKISIVSNAPGAGFAGGGGGEDEDLLEDPTGSSSARNSFGKSSVLSNTWAFARKLSSSSPSQRKTSSVRSFGNGAQQAQATVAQVLAASSRNYSAKPAFASKWYFDEAELHRLETPLWMAVRYGRKEVVEALLHCGCVPRPNSKSESPAKVAEQLGFADVAALLYEHCPTETSSVGKCKPSKSTSDDPAACINSMARTGSDHGSEAPSKVSSSNPSPGIHAVVCEAEAALAGAAEAAGPEKRPEQKQEFCSSTWEAACAPWQKAADIHFDAVDALAELVENDILHIESYESLCDWYFSLGAASWERVYVFWKLFCNQGAFLQAAMEEAEKEKTRLGGGEAALLMQPGLKGNRNMMSTTVAGMSTEFASRTAYRSTGVSSHQPTMTSGSGNPGNFHLLSTPAAAARLFGTRILRRWAAEDLHCFESSLATLAAGNKGHVDGGQYQHQQQAAAAIAKDVRSPGLHSESYYNYDYFANAFYSSVPIPGRRISDNDKDKVDPMLLTDMMDIV
eukprot:g13292.t1